MKAERWKRVEEPFEAAQLLPLDRRGAFLLEACPGDAGEPWNAGASPGSMWVSTLDGKRVGKFNLEPPQRVVDQWLANPPRLLIPFGGRKLSDGASVAVLPISADGTKVTGPAERLTFGTGYEGDASSANGLIAFSAFNRELHVWGVPVDADGHAAGVPKQVTSGAAGERVKCVSRDGGDLVFQGLQTNHHTLFVKDLKTGKEQEIPWEGQFLDYAVLSPDSSKIVFSSDADLNRPSGVIYEVPVSGGFPKKI